MKILKKLLALIKKEEQRHIPTMEELKQEDAALTKQEEELQKLLKPRKKATKRTGKKATKRKVTKKKSTKRKTAKKAKKTTRKTKKKR